MTSAPGQVFTPPKLAARIWRLAVAHHQTVDHTLTVVDPAAGEGALLAPVLDETPDSVGTVRAIAIELDRALVDGLRRRFSERVEVVHADALMIPYLDDATERLHSAAPSPAELRAHASAGLRSETADIVVANPPYLRETGNAATFRRLRSWHDGAWSWLYRKDCDLHHFFWPVAAHLLRPGGVLVALTPAYYLESESAAPLRKWLLTHGRLEAVWRERASSTAFPGVGVEAAVAVWRKGRSAGDGACQARLLDDELRSTGDLIEVPADGSPWWTAPPPSSVPPAGPRLGDCFRIVEGVSTAANRLRRRDVDKVAGGVAGEGIFLLTDDELARLDPTPGEHARFVRQRCRTSGSKREWILLVRDGSLEDFERQDDDVVITGAVARHLWKFREVLRDRAEMRRNPSRSWYAVAWPRDEIDAPGVLVTPKWAAQPCFRPLANGEVPMTDFRALIPRSDRIAHRAPEIAAWLNGPDGAAWLRARLKRKGRLLELYGAALAAIRLPREIVGSHEVD